MGDLRAPVQGELPLRGGRRNPDPEEVGAKKSGGVYPENQPGGEAAGTQDEPLHQGGKTQ